MNNSSQLIQDMKNKNRLNANPSCDLIVIEKSLTRLPKVLTFANTPSCMYMIMLIYLLGLPSSYAHHSTFLGTLS